MLKRYKSLEEASEDLPFFVKKLRKGKDHPMEVPFMGIPYPHGIKRFKTLEEANKERERWILERNLRESARHLKKKT